MGNKDWSHKAFSTCLWDLNRLLIQSEASTHFREIMVCVWQGGTPKLLVQILIFNEGSHGLFIEHVIQMRAGPDVLWFWIRRDRLHLHMLLLSAFGFNVCHPGSLLYFVLCYLQGLWHRKQKDWTRTPTCLLCCFPTVRKGNGPLWMLVDIIHLQDNDADIKLTSMTVLWFWTLAYNFFNTFLIPTLSHQLPFLFSWAWHLLWG